MEVSSRFIALIAVFLLFTACSSELALNEEYLSKALTKEQLKLIDDFKKGQMDELASDGPTAISVALFSKDEAFWQATYGKLSAGGKDNKADSLFSIQSMSKSFTAVAVLHAVERGLLDLDKPIRHYLPTFRVQSRFAGDPLAQMTLRMLLNHSAGFTHEAPVENNYDVRSKSFEEHVLSIQDTWLVFPPGTGFRYSNLGIDLAAWILSVESGMPYDEYLKQNVLLPLAMTDSTVNKQEVEQHKNRAIGHEAFIKSIPAFTPMSGAGGVYTSIQDLTKFVQLFLNQGAPLLSPVLVQQMYKAGKWAPYGLGLQMANNGSITQYYHGGGGFGFNTMMRWIPDKNLGMAIITNHAATNSNLANYSDALLQGFVIASEGGELAPFNHFWPAPYQDPSFEPAPYSKKYEQYTGKYHITMNGYELETYAQWAVDLGMSPHTIRIGAQNSHLVLDNEPLMEYIPGVFFTQAGETLDFRTGHLLYQGVIVKKL